MGMGIDDLERMNKLPKSIASPEMDLEQLKRLPEYRRRQWWDEVLRIEEEYYGRFYLEGATNEFLEANIAMAKLKLVVPFLDNGERSPEHGFKEDEMAFLRGFDELAVIGRLSVDELVDYFKRVRGKERGLVKIAFDAVNKGYNVTYEISGVFKSIIGEVPIRAKEFKYLCDTGVSPEAVKAELKKTFSEKDAARLALSFKTVQELDRMCNQEAKTEEYQDKLLVLKNYTEGFSDKFTKHLEEFSRFMKQEQLEYLDDKYKVKVRRFCTNLVDVWISEFLKG